MKTVSSISLSGGQGKSSVVFLLALYLAQKRNKQILVVDCDPQADATFYLGHEVKSGDPTLLEVLNGQVQTEDGIYETDLKPFLIPSDRNLTKIVPYLINTGTAASILRRRLKSVKNAFDYALLDVQPSISQISLTAAGAADFVLIPCEALVKGVNSLVSTLEFLDQQRDLDAFTGQILGVIPFRDRIVGCQQTKASRNALAAMAEISNLPILPSIVESERYKQALDLGKLPPDEFLKPFETITEILENA